MAGMSTYPYPSAHPAVRQAAEKSRAIDRLVTESNRVAAVLRRRAAEGIAELVAEYRP